MLKCIPVTGRQEYKRTVRKTSLEIRKLKPQALPPLQVNFTGSYTRRIPDPVYGFRDDVPFPLCGGTHVFLFAVFGFALLYT